MKRLLWLSFLLGVVAAVTLPILAQATDVAAEKQTETQNARKQKRRHHHKNHHKGHIKPDQYPKSGED